METITIYYTTYSETQAESGGAVSLNDKQKKLAIKVVLFDKCSSTEGNGGGIFGNASSITEDRACLTLCWAKEHGQAQSLLASPGTNHTQELISCSQCYKEPKGRIYTSYQSHGRLKLKLGNFSDGRVTSHGCLDLRPTDDECEFSYLTISRNVMGRIICYNPWAGKQSGTITNTNFVSNQYGTTWMNYMFFVSMYGNLRVKETILAENTYEKLYQNDANAGFDTAGCIFFGNSFDDKEVKPVSTYKIKNYQTAGCLAIPTEVFSLGEKRYPKLFTTFLVVEE